VSIEPVTNSANVNTGEIMGAVIAPTPTMDIITEGEPTF
jgi:hypothetical protein